MNFRSESFVDQRVDVWDRNRYSKDRMVMHMPARIAQVARMVVVVVWKDKVRSGA